MAKSGEKLRTVHLKFSDNELKEIDAWKEDNHIRTRSEAIRQMLRHTIESTDDFHHMAEQERKFMKPSLHDGEISEELARAINETVQREVDKVMKKSLKDNSKK